MAKAAAERARAIASALLLLESREAAAHLRPADQVIGVGVSQDVPHPPVGRTLRARFPEIAEAQPETLAHHFAQAGMPSEAVELWTKARELARQRSANAVAGAHLLKAL